MTSRGFWARAAVTTVLAVALLLAVSPARPEPRLPQAVALAAGAAAGVLLFVGAARRVPGLPSARRGLPVLVARQGVLGLWAANEEILWRRIVLGELLPAGPLAAVAVSSLGFALAHRRRQVLHVSTGACFGGVYLATGSLGASVAAHWSYNVLVGALADRPP
jgi:membrane protease YdiL (CAAX protease family)